MRFVWKGNKYLPQLWNAKGIIIIFLFDNGPGGESQKYFMACFKVKIYFPNYFFLKKPTSIPPPPQSIGVLLSVIFRNSLGFLSMRFLSMNILWYSFLVKTNRTFLGQMHLGIQPF